MLGNTAFSQTKQEPEKVDAQQRWEDMQERIKYQRPNGLDYPDKTYGNPPGIEEENYYSDDVTESDGGVYFDDEDIERSRRKQFGSKGTKTEVKIEKNRKDQIEDLDIPDVDIPDVDLPDIDLPDVDLPDIDLPDVDLPNVDGSFWKSLLIIALIVGLAFLLYFLFVKNGVGQGPKNSTIEMSDDDMWNPTLVTKSELELKLEEAIAKEDYRSCVRIYFTFILKELIVKRWIRWEKEKTNHHYLLEMLPRPEGEGFNKSVNIFEIVWYGDYSIKKAQYQELEPVLKNYYKKLQNS